MKSAAGQYAQGRSIQLLRTLLGLGVILFVGAFAFAKANQRPNSRFAQSYAAACRRGCLPSENSGSVDGAGTDYVTRVVPVPRTVSPEAQRLIGSNFANRLPAHQHKLRQSRAYADATEARLAREESREADRIIAKFFNQHLLG